MASVRWSPDGARLASASADGTVRIWDAETQEEELRLDGGSAGDLGAHSQGISDVQWSFDGRLLCTCSDDKTLRLWDAASGECLRVLRGHTHFVMCCAFNRQGSVVASGAYDETVRLWEVKTGACVRKLPSSWQMRQNHPGPTPGVRASFFKKHYRPEHATTSNIAKVN